MTIIRKLNLTAGQAQKHNHAQVRHYGFWIFFVVVPITVFFTLMIFLVQGKVTRGEFFPLSLLPNQSKILQVL